MPPVLMWLAALYAHATVDLKEMESTAQVRSSYTFLQKQECLPLTSMCFINVWVEHCWITCITHLYMQTLMSVNGAQITAMWMPPVLMWLVALYAHATVDLKEMESTAQVCRKFLHTLAKGENVLTLMFYLCLFAQQYCIAYVCIHLYMQTLMSVSLTQTTAMWMPPVLMWLVALYAHATVDLKEMESTAWVRSSCIFFAKGENVPHLHWHLDCYNYG